MTSFNFTKFFLSDESKKEKETYKFNLIILNQPICKIELLKKLWDAATIKICADGGANRLFDNFTNEEDRSKFIPNYIIGDLDSVTNETKLYYQNKGTIVEKVSSQDSTDFQKCLNKIDELLSKEHHENVVNSYETVALGALGGRFDQSIHSIHVLFRNREKKIYLASNDSMAIFVPKNLNVEIICDLRFEGPTCGLLPIGCEIAKVKTRGLKWDIDHFMPLSFGTLVSSSNAFADVEDSQYKRIIYIETDTPIIWTTELHGFKK
ncbi:cAMP-dependent protein kinase subunit [Lobulomyces angularis]|nr:cAMP-dependent protein kinase subunit [Lobulomyces angularis]